MDRGKEERGRGREEGSGKGGRGDKKKAGRREDGREKGGREQNTCIQGGLELACLAKDRIWTSRNSYSNNHFLPLSFPPFLVIPVPRSL